MTSQTQETEATVYAISKTPRFLRRSEFQWEVDMSGGHRMAFETKRAAEQFIRENSRQESST